MNDLLRRRRAMMKKEQSELIPIYSLTNYQIARQALDTGIYLSQSGKQGYTVILKVDFTRFTGNACTILKECGYYYGQWYFYFRNNNGVYGSTGSHVLYGIRNNDKQWLSTLAISASQEKIITIVNGNAYNTALSGLDVSTETLKINPDNLADLTPVIVESLKIYDVPMSEAQMRKLLE